MPTARPQASLQSYTGIWNMPNARVLPDWHARLKYGNADPYDYYGGALGAFDWLEVHGQFTQTNTITVFEGLGDYGYLKDRAAGARLVLFKENRVLPQVAAGFFDATGNAHFGSRYLVASKIFGNVDFTLGLGQGILAGEFVAGASASSSASNEDAGQTFLISDPFRTTRPFGGLEWYVTPNLTLSAEYSSIDYSRMFGFINTNGGAPLKEDDTEIPINIGIKYNLNSAMYLQAGILGGVTFFGGIGIDFSLSPGELIGWKKKTSLSCHRANPSCRRQGNSLRSGPNDCR